MTKNKDNMTPKLRFKGFTDDWEQRKLSDLIQTMRGGASIAPNDYKDTGVATVPKGAINPTGVADLSGSKYVSKNFFEKNGNSTVTSGGLVTSLRDLVPSAPNMGRIVKVKGKCQRYLMPQGVYSILLQDKVDENFLISFSNTSKFRKIISKEKNGSTQVHIRNSEYLGITINTPGIEEQNQIGNFLKQLDNAITLHQRKLEQLKQLKEALLQQMFPQKDENVPKLRFSNFDGEWEQHKLGDVIKSYAGGTPTATKSEYYNGNIPFIRSAEINSKDTELYLTEEGLKNSSAKLVEKGDILYALYGATSGEVGISQINGAINQAILAIKPNENYDTIFIMQWLRRQKESIINRFLQGGQGNLSGAIVKSLSFHSPITSDEQFKIGKFLKIIDEIITLHQQKLEKMKLIKQSLLQDLFI